MTPQQDPIRLVVADDTPSVRLLLTMALPLYGDFEVVAEASNGAEAVSAVRQHQPDALVVDLCMPVMDGLKAVQAIREFDTDVHIVMFSGQYQGDEAVAVGADTFMLKGSDMERLASALATDLAVRRRVIGLNRADADRGIA